MTTYVISFLVVVILTQLLCADRSQRRAMLERNERLRFFLKTLEDRQNEFISLTEVLLREATEHPVSIRRSNEIPGPPSPPTWTAKKKSDEFIGKATPRG